VKGIAQLFRRKCHSLAKCDGSRIVIDTDDQQVHLQQSTMRDKKVMSSVKSLGPGNDWMTQQSCKSRMNAYLKIPHQVHRLRDTARDVLYVASLGEYRYLTGQLQNEDL